MVEAYIREVEQGELEVSCFFLSRLDHPFKFVCVLQPPAPTRKEDEVDEYIRSVERGVVGNLSFWSYNPMLTQILLSPFEKFLLVHLHLPLSLPVVRVLDLIRPPFLPKTQEQVVAADANAAERTRTATVPVANLIPMPMPIQTTPITMLCQ